MRINPQSIARASAIHPWRTLGVWVVVLVAGIAGAATLLGPALTTDFDFTNSPEAKRAEQILEEKLTGPDRVTETFIVVSEDATVGDPAFAAHVNGVLQDVAALGSEAVSASPASFPPPESAQQDPVRAALGPFPSEEGNAVLFTVVMAGDIDEAAEHVEDLETIREDATGSGFETLILGQATSTEEFKRISEEDLRVGEGIGIAAALIVLVIVFGALVAGVSPIIMAIFAITVTLGIVGLIGQMWRFSFFAPNLISMMGLAVGIDYSLFIVSRYREERQRGREKLDAIGAAGATANRAVFFSGMMVVLALAGMLIVPTTIFRSLAGGAIVVVLVSVAASMTLLPAVIGLLGDKLNAGRILGRRRADLEHGRPGGFWDRVSRGVMRRPVVGLIGASALLIVLALPYFLQTQPDGNGRGIKQGLAGISTLPDDSQTKQAFDALVANFPENGIDTPAQVVVVADNVTDPAVASSVEELGAVVSDDPSLGVPGEPQISEDGTVALVEIPLAGAAVDTQSEAATEVIDQLRTEYVPEAFEGSGATVLVGGESAFIKDFFDVSDQYNPIILALVLALSFVLLTVVFRSLVVPAKAIVMNLLSVGAAYGLIVLVFQKGGPGIGESIANLLGFEQVEAIEAWLPLFLFSILFGLSMDYHVFLLTRIREHYDRTGNNTESVAYGLRTTGGIITGAAIIMVAVFAGFAAGRLSALQEMGFGLAVAVFMDATIVRSILVPSAMKLLGDRNWYLPKWLQWLPKLDVEGHEAAERQAEIPDTPAELVEAGSESGKRPGDFG
jgi:putative drug exporter of the RND superfamily